MSQSLAYVTRYDIETDDAEYLHHRLDEWSPGSIGPVGLRQLMPDATAGPILRGPSATRRRFRELREEWVADTLFMSSTAEAVAHPAYLGIVGLGLECIGLIATELRQNPTPMWFPALVAIVGHDEAFGAQSVDEATSIWLRWMHDNGYGS